MSLFQIVFKQMRQRALSTWLTLLSVVLGVTLVVAILILRREGQGLFGQTEYGYDVLVGARGSPLQLTLNTVYHMDKSPGNIPYSLYEELDHGERYREHVRLAVPLAVGDSYMGQRIVATTNRMFNADETGRPGTTERFEVRPDRPYRVEQGRLFHERKFEAVVGSEVPQRTGLQLGSTFQATHGMPAPGESPDIHEELWTVVGVLAPTHTANDRVLFIPLVTFYCIFEHEEGLEAQAAIRAEGEGEHHEEDGHEEGHHEEHHHGEEQYTMNLDGTLDLRLPKDDWQLSAVLVRSRSPYASQSLQYVINNRNEAAAVNPASVMREFFRNFLDASAKVLLIVSFLVTLVAAASIMTTIYNSVAARRKEVGILRALGATRRRVLALICLEAGMVGLIGGVGGLLAGHLLGAAGSAWLQRVVGEGIDWVGVGLEEWLYLVAVLAIATVAGLVPGLKAYRVPVATSLVSG